jgi:hypothetical protein
MNFENLNTASILGSLGEEQKASQVSVSTATLGKQQKIPIH